MSVSAHMIFQQNGDGYSISCSRDDLLLTLPITVLNENNTGITNWLWEIVDRPNGSMSIFTLSGTNVSTFATDTFVPDKAGTYLINLKVNAGASLDQKGAAIKTTKLKYRIPAAKESIEFDGYRGWATATDLAWQSIDDSLTLINPIPTVIVFDAESGGMGTYPITMANKNIFANVSNGNINLIFPDLAHSPPGTEFIIFVGGDAAHQVSFTPDIASSIGGQPGTLGAPFIVFPAQNEIVSFKATRGPSPLNNFWAVTAYQSFNPVPFDSANFSNSPYQLTPGNVNIITTLSTGNVVFNLPDNSHSSIGTEFTIWIFTGNIGATATFHPPSGESINLLNADIDFTITSSGSLNTSIMVKLIRDSAMSWTLFIYTENIQPFTNIATAQSPYNISKIDKNIQADASLGNLVLNLPNGTNGTEEGVEYNIYYFGGSYNTISITPTNGEIIDNLGPNIPFVLTTQTNANSAIKYIRLTRVNNSWKKNIILDENEVLINYSGGSFTLDVNTFFRATFLLNPSGAFDQIRLPDGTYDGQIIKIINKVSSITNNSQSAILTTETTSPDFMTINILDIQGASLITNGVIPGDILTIAMDTGGSTNNGIYSILKVLNSKLLVIDGVFPVAHILDSSATYGITDFTGTIVRRAPTISAGPGISAGSILYNTFNQETTFLWNNTIGSPTWRILEDSTPLIFENNIIKRRQHIQYTDLLSFTGLNTLTLNFGNILPLGSQILTAAISMGFPNGAFSGGTVSACRINVGSSGSSGAILNQNMFIPISHTFGGESGGDGSPQLGNYGNTQLQWKITITGDTFEHLTSGGVVFEATFYVAPNKVYP